MAHLPDNLVGVEDIEERVNLNRTTIWKRAREHCRANAGQAPPGAYKIGSRNWRYDPQMFSKWLLNEETAVHPKPQPADERKEPTPSEIKSYFSQRSTASAQRMDNLQAGLTRLEGKLDTWRREFETFKQGSDNWRREFDAFTREVLAMVRNGRHDNASRRSRRS